MLQRTVNPFPLGKQWWFESTLADQIKAIEYSSPVLLANGAAYGAVSQYVAQLVAWEPWMLRVAGSSPAVLTKLMLK